MWTRNTERPSSYVSSTSRPHWHLQFRKLSWALKIIISWKKATKRVMDTTTSTSSRMKKVMGVCPWGYLTDKICIYFSWKEACGNKFKNTTVYPFSRAYHFLKQRRNGMAPFQREKEHTALLGAFQRVKELTALLGATTLIEVNDPTYFPEFF